jgi:hypothetical protein
MDVMIMLCVGRYAVHIVDNVGKPPCTCMIFQCYFRQIKAVVLSELYTCSSHKSKVKQNSWFIVKASSLCVIMLCVSAMMAVMRKNLYKNVQRKVSIDEFTFLCTFLYRDFAWRYGWNIKHNFVETGCFLKLINCFDCNCLLNVLAEPVRCLSACDLCC